VSEKITAWVSCDTWDGLTGISDQPNSYSTPIQITRRQYELIRDAMHRRRNAEEFVLRALGLKRSTFCGTVIDHDVDDSLLPE
jgi:hypothetical protein